MVSGERVARILTAIHEAGGESAEPRPFEAELALWFSAHSVQIGSWNPETGQVEVWVSPAACAALNPDLARTICRPSGASVATSRSRAGEHLLVAAFPQVQSEVWTVIVMSRAGRARGFGGTAVARLQALLPHLRKALPIYRRTAQLRWERRLCDQALESMSLAIMVAAGDGRLRWANDVATILLQERRVLSLRHGRIRIVGGSEDELFQQTLASACAIPGTADLLRLGASGGGHLLVQVRPLPDRSMLQSDAEGGLAVIHARRARAEPLALQNKLARLYGLTRAEARIAEAIVNGDSMPEFCSKARVTMNTAKTLRKRAFAKFGCRSQGRLMHELLANPFLAAAPQPAPPSVLAARRAAQSRQGAACASVAGWKPACARRKSAGA